MYIGFRVSRKFIDQIETWRYDSIEKTVTSKYNNDLL